MVPGNCQDLKALSHACQLLGKKEKDLLAVFLCGSRARGDHREDSDYDIMIVMGSALYDTFEYEQQYGGELAKRSAIEKELLQVSIWTLESFEEGRKKGNSFIYCALRDGKMFFSRGNLNLQVPEKHKEAGLERLKVARETLEHLESSLEYPKKRPLRELDFEYLGYISMHLCWAVCMLNNFCPVSKYTVLKECRKYFTKEEFRSIKRAYKLYANQSGEGMRKKTFMVLLKRMKTVLERIEGKYLRKDCIRKPSGKQATKHMKDLYTETELYDSDNPPGVAPQPQANNPPEVA